MAEAEIKEENENRVEINNQDLDICFREIENGQAMEGEICDITKVRNCMLKAMKIFVNTIKSLYLHFIDDRNMYYVIFISFYIEYFLWFLLYTCNQYNIIEESKEGKEIKETKNKFKFNWASGIGETANYFIKKVYWDIDVLNGNLKIFLQILENLAIDAMLETIILSTQGLDYDTAKRMYLQSCHLDDIIKKTLPGDVKISKDTVNLFIEKFISVFIRFLSHGLSGEAGRKLKINLVYNANANGFFSVLYLRNELEKYSYNCITGTLLEFYVYQKAFKIPTAHLNVELQGEVKYKTWSTLPKLVEKTTHWCTNFRRITTRSGLQKINSINIGDKLFLPIVTYQLFSYYKKYVMNNLSATNPFLLLYLDVFNQFYRAIRLIFEDDPVSIEADYQKQINDERKNTKYQEAFLNYFILLVEEKIYEIQEIKNCPDLEQYRKEVNYKLINLFRTKNPKTSEDLLTEFKKTKLFFALSHCFPYQHYLCMTLEEKECSTKICDWSGKWYVGLRNINGKSQPFCVPKDLTKDFGTTYDGPLAKKYIEDLSNITAANLSGGGINYFHKYQKYKYKCYLLEKMLQNK